MSTQTTPRAFSFIPEWLVSYRKEWLPLDVVAGMTTAAVIIPTAMAYATIAGLPVQVGLYTAFLPLAIYALLGSSRALSVSTTTTIAILTAAELDEVAPNADPAMLLTATATIALLVGAMLVLASILKLGFVASFISEPVLVGFKTGIGFVIVVDQVPKILGLHFPKSGFVRNLIALFRHIPEAKPVTLAVGVGVIIILLAFRRYVPKAPAPLVAIAAAIAGSSLLNLHAHGVDLVGRIPKGLPSFTAPAINLMYKLWPGSLGIALMSFTETIAAGRAFANSDEPSPKANQELLATGFANIGGALLGAMPGGGGTTQTAVNRSAGARTQVAEIVTSAVALVTMLVLAPLLGLMPLATLAGVVIVYSTGLIKVAEFRAILRVRRTEFIWAVVACGGVVLVGTLKGILIAIIVSMVSLAHQVADPPVWLLGRKPGTNVFRPHSKHHPEDEGFPGLLMLRIEGRIFFANAEHIFQKIKALIEMKDLVDEMEPTIALDLSGVPDLEYSALKMLIAAEKRLREGGKRLWLVGMNPHVLQMVERSQLGTALGHEAMHFNMELAVAKYLETAATAR